MADPYKSLGVSRDASQDDIRAAYRKLAKQFHPDLNPDNANAEARFKEVAAANDLLSDPETRGKFDRGEIGASGQEARPPPGYRNHAEGEAGTRYSRASGQSEEWSSDDFGDIFGSMFRGRQAAGSARMRGDDERYTLWVDFIDAVNGATPRLTLPNGMTLDVRIPSGTRDGQVLRLRGKGSAGFNEGPPGDALVEIHITPHRYFERDGMDIRLVLPVTIAEAALGGPVEIPTPGGPVSMQIPPRSDTGLELRLRGRGVPATKERAAGNLYATLRVVIGTPDPDFEEFLRSRKSVTENDPRKSMWAQ